MAISAASASGTNSIGLQDFLRILTSQLTYQDPLKPMDNEEFVAQMAQFSSLEQSQQLNSKIDQLLSVQSAAQSVGLLGKTVDAADSNGNVFSGQVTALSLSGSQPQLTITTSTGSVVSGISFSKISAVR